MLIKKINTFPVEKLSRAQSKYIMNEYLRSGASRTHVCRFMVLYLIHKSGGCMTRLDLFKEFLEQHPIESQNLQKTKARIGKQIETSLTTAYIKKLQDAEEPTYQLTSRGALMVISEIQSRAALLTCDPRLSCSEVMTLVCEEEVSSHGGNSNEEDVLVSSKSGSSSRSSNDPFRPLSAVMEAWSHSIG